MHLYLVRHAEAANTHPDPARELTTRGWREAEALGRYLRGRLPNDVVVRHSPYARARQTWEALAREWEWPRERAEVDARLVPEGDGAQLWAEWGGGQERALLLVGHNPHLTTLALHLLGGSDTLLHLSKACFAHLESFTPRRAGSWTLHCLLPPEYVATGVLNHPSRL